MHIKCDYFFFNTQCEMFGKRTQNMIVFFAFEKHLQHSGAFFPLPLHWRGLGARPPIVPVQKRKTIALGTRANFITPSQAVPVSGGTRLLWRLGPGAEWRRDKKRATCYVLEPLRAGPRHASICRG